VAQVCDRDLILVLTENWTDFEFDPAELAPLQALLKHGSWNAVRFEASQMPRLGSPLLAFLDSIRSMALRLNIRFDETGLPDTAKKLMQLIAIAAPVTEASRRPASFIERLGQSVIDAYCELSAGTRLVGQVILRSGAALRGQARLRRVDVLASLMEAGSGALPVVALVNVLVGGIVAFVGAV